MIAKQARRAHRCCWATRCREQGCRFSFPGDEASCLDGTTYQDTHQVRNQLCDCVLFWSRASGDDVVAPVELKSGKPDVSEAVAQIQAGANVALQLLARAGIDPETVTFMPVLVKGKGLSKRETGTLRKSRITFGSRRVLVQVANCGDRLPAVIRRVS